MIATNKPMFFCDFQQPETARPLLMQMALGKALDTVQSGIQSPEHQQFVEDLQAKLKE
ncbi:MAG: hypothetical protein AAF702_03700 [Chloroflexota bacterium]